METDAMMSLLASYLEMTSWHCGMQSLPIAPATPLGHYGQLGNPMGKLKHLGRAKLICSFHK